MTFAINNCRLDLEDRQFLELLTEAPMNSSEWGAFKRPAEVSVDWHRSENQRRLGSCQGWDLSSILERLAHVKGLSIQLSAIFAYLATQKVDGLLGRDAGSTISNGAKVGFKIGLPKEDLTGYPTEYPGRAAIARILSEANYLAAREFKAESIWQVPRDVDQCFDFIGGGGGISFGISWYQGLIPRDRIVRKFEPSRNRVLGGHAMCVLGYTRDGRFKAMNSHADGPYDITPEAWLQMLNHRNTAAVGLMGNPEATPIDWYENSPYYK